MALGWRGLRATLSKNVLHITILNKELVLDQAEILFKLSGLPGKVSIAMNIKHSSINNSIELIYATSYNKGRNDDLTTNIIFT